MAEVVAALVGEEPISALAAQVVAGRLGAGFANFGLELGIRLFVLRLWTSACPMYATNTSRSIALSTTIGAVSPVVRRAAPKVVVIQWLCGTYSMARSDVVPRAYRRVMFVFAQVSSMKPNGRDRPGCAGISGRNCDSAGRSDSFNVTLSATKALCRVARLTST